MPTNETDEQILLFDMLTLLSNRPGCDKVKWVHAIPNFAWMNTGGGRDNKTAAAVARSLRQGKKPGVWDVFAPFPRQWTDAQGEKWFVCGLYIEMKIGKNPLTDNQKAFQADLQDSFEWAVCHSAVEAFCVICRYLGEPYISKGDWVLRSLGHRMGIESGQGK